MVRVKLEDVCERGTSNLKMSDVTDLSGNYPIYGAAGYIGNVDFYHQINPYVAIVKLLPFISAALFPFTDESS